MFSPETIRDRFGQEILGVCKDVFEEKLEDNVIGIQDLYWGFTNLLNTLGKITAGGSGFGEMFLTQAIIYLLSKEFGKRYPPDFRDLVNSSNNSFELENEKRIVNIFSNELDENLKNKMKEAKKISDERRLSKPDVLLILENRENGERKYVIFELKIGSGLTIDKTKEEVNRFTPIKSDISYFFFIHIDVNSKKFLPRILDEIRNNGWNNLYLISNHTTHVV